MGFDDLDLEKATNKQKGNYGEYLADDNLINNPKLNMLMWFSLYLYKLLAESRQ